MERTELDLDMLRNALEDILHEFADKVVSEGYSIMSIRGLMEPFIDRIINAIDKEGEGT